MSDQDKVRKVEARIRAWPLLRRLRNWVAVPNPLETAEEAAREIERAKRIMQRAASWLQIKEAANVSSKGKAIIEEMLRFIADLPAPVPQYDDQIQHEIASCRRWRNKATGDLYEVLALAVDCTNDREATLVVIYYAVGCVAVPQFVREAEEFRQKFDPADAP